MLEGQKEDLDVAEGIGGEHGARGCRAEALVVVDACGRVDEWQGLAQLSQGECFSGCLSGEQCLLLRKMKGGRKECCACGGQRVRRA